MKCKFLFVCTLAMLASWAGRGQSTANDDQIRVFYEEGISHLKNGKPFEASASFENVIKLDPNHKDALYRLALISEQLKDFQSAIRYLVRGLRLNDKRASRYLVDKFHYELSYADTMQNIDLRTRQKYLLLKTSNLSTFSDLTNAILSATNDRREQLQLVLLWTYHNMSADSERFFEGGNPLSTSEAFERRTGLCDEYANIMEEFCKAANIPSYKIAGYVKYPDFKPETTFTETNHAWNAVYIESSWLMCDLFWSTSALDTKAASPHFVRRLETQYFLGLPKEFVNDHLPADPIFQFSDSPVSLRSFVKNKHGIDKTVPAMEYLNYADSLDLLSKMSRSDRDLRIAQHSYSFNSDNPNDLIVEAYNYAVNIVNKRAASKGELSKARRSLVGALAIIDRSKNNEVRSLKEHCEKGITILDKRLAGK